MATSLKLSISKTIPTNITSNLAMSSDYSHFATLTRQLATTNSQWIYRLDFYDALTQTKKQTIDVFDSYNTDRHFIAFVPGPSSRALLAVASVNNLIFYRSNPLEQVVRMLHKQPNVYDLKASMNGELVVLVGQTIMIYRTVGFKQIVFPQIVENARYCDFSSDGFYMVIASTSSINLYTYRRLNDNYQFQQVPLTLFQSPVEYGSITSIQFNPRNSSELLVGYLSSSPGFYSIQNGGTFFKKQTDIQPMSSENAKVARYMPDHDRFYSYDYLDGVGIWPGLNNKLYYKQNFMLYGASSNSVGTTLIGYVWEQIKIADILLSCGGTEGATCSCSQGQAWDYANYNCSKLICLQAEYTTGVVENNSCQCISGFKWNPVQRKCAIDCSVINKALPVQPSLYQCYCGDNWSWNAFTRSCQFDCTQIPYSSGVLVSANVCDCLTGFIWNPSLLQCQCPQYMSPSGSICLCYSNYYLNDKGQCVADCTQIANAVGPTDSFQECQCKEGHYFKVRDGTAGCQLNCSAIKDTRQQYDFSTCMCREHMDWLNSTCVVNCKQIDYSDAVGLFNNTCACAINYHWRDQIKQCARNCQGVKYTVPNGESTLRACPCIKNFLWSQTNTRCQIQCSKIPNSEQYSLSELNKCECRPGFVWSEVNYNCEVDCKNIWNAKGRVNDSYCQCNDNMPFNSTSLTCASAKTAGVFSSTLSIVGFAIGCVVALIIMIILVRFCWSFKTENNEEHEKKIKSKDGKKKKNKMLKQEKAPPMMQEELKTDERFVSPTKIKTATTL